MRRTLWSMAVVCSLVVAVGHASPAGADPGRPPSSMAALGDSITRGFNACGWYVECTSRSFSTGSNASVQSHYLRILAVNPAISGRNHNLARSGAQADDLARQAGLAASRQVDYVTILIGANDACTSSEASMTSPATFQAEVRAAMQTLAATLPQARVFVASIPDIRRLWSIGRGNPWIRLVWSQFGICQSMLANAGSDAPADVARRQRVYDRVVAFNTALAAECGASPNCVYDGGAVFRYPFTLADVSPWDYFHPDSDGQRVLAQVTYAAGFDWG
jgi:lysophospholipase L1-like esterase